MKVEVEDSYTEKLSRMESNSPDDENCHIMLHPSQSHKVSLAFKCRIVKSNREARTLRDEEKWEGNQGGN